MAEWATMHGTLRSPALRRSLIVLVGRSRAAGLLLVAWVLAGAAYPVSAAPLSTLALRDISGPGVSGARDGEVTISSPGASGAPIASGKSTRLSEIQRQGSVVAVIEDP